MVSWALILTTVQSTPSLQYFLFQKTFPSVCLHSLTKWIWRFAWEAEKPRSLAAAADMIQWDDIYYAFILPAATSSWLWHPNRATTDLWPNLRNGDAIKVCFKPKDWSLVSLVFVWCTQACVNCQPIVCLSLCLHRADMVIRLKPQQLPQPAEHQHAFSFHPTPLPTLSPSCLSPLLMLQQDLI